MYEWLNCQYVRLYSVPSRDALCRTDTLLVGSRISSMKTAYRESCPANVLQVSDLIFDPCFKVLKRPVISLIIASWAVNPISCGQITFILLNVRRDISIVAVVLYVRVTSLVPYMYKSQLRFSNSTSGGPNLCSYY